MAIRRIKVEHNLGAITAFVAINRFLFGLAAMHVLTGDDNSIDKSEHIDVYEEIEMKWLSGGLTNNGYFSRGNNLPPNDYGTFDAGIFTLSDSFGRFVGPRIRVLKINPFILRGQFAKLKGMLVYSYSGMYEKPISGVIDQVFVMSSVGNRYDFSIVSTDNEVMVAKGDSGLLWYDSNNAAVGMHISGIADESSVSFSTFIHRIVDFYKIQSLYAL